MPEFKPLAIEPGLFFKLVSAADLHMAHCEAPSKGNSNSMTSIPKTKKYVDCFFNYNVQ